MSHPDDYLIGECSACYALVLLRSAREHRTWHADGDGLACDVRAVDQP